MKNNLLVLSEFFSSFQTTGMICPTSRLGAKALCQPLSVKNRPSLKIVELGSGTGPISLEILKHLKAGDELILCEINSNFMKVLQENLSSNPDFYNSPARINFFEGPAQNLKDSGLIKDKIDVFVCSIPFLNFEVKVIAEIFAAIKELSHEKTVMTYYEYIGLKNLGKVFSSSARKIRMQELDTFFQSLIKPAIIDIKPIWLNVLPIHVFSLATNKLAVKTS